VEWKTWLTERVGIKYPIIAGALHRIGTSALAAPFSEAGGLGNIVAGSFDTPEELTADIRKAREMTDKPIAVNISLGGACANPAEMRDAAIDQKVDCIFTSVYNAEEHGKVIKAAGIPWIHKIATMKHALAAEQQGADAVIIVGVEGVGQKNRYQNTTLINMVMANRLLKIPFIAAGGIGDARSFLAAMAMGAQGVYLGTATMALAECPWSEKGKQLLVEADSFDPETIERVFQPPTPERDDKIKQGERVRAGESGGNAWLGSMAVGMIDRVKTARELIDEIITGAEEILKGDNALANSLRTL
jgi:nitronate monooxygenase